MIETAVREQGILPGTLTLGTDNGSAFTAKATRLVLSALGVTQRRGGYRGLRAGRSSRAGSATSRSGVWRHEFETLEQAREMIAAYVETTTTTGPTAGSTTEHPAKSVRLGTTHKEYYKTSRPKLSTPRGALH